MNNGKHNNELGKSENIVQELVSEPEDAQVRYPCGVESFLAVRKGYLTPQSVYRRWGIEEMDTALT